jgi:hypothetical protein
MALPLDAKIRPQSVNKHRDVQDEDIEVCDPAIGCKQQH